MAISLLSLIFPLLTLTPNASAYYQPDNLKPKTNTPSSSSYIIHTDNLTRPSIFPTQSHWYSSILKSAVANQTYDQDRIFYTYDTIMHGFAATLTPDEARKVSSTPGVIGVYNDSIFELHTTRSPNFLGLNLGDGLWTDKFDAGDNVVIGLVDTGIWPEEPSFDDAGLPPIPPEWRGECEIRDRFNISACNKKLIGARFFRSGARARGLSFDDGSEFMSPRDKDGHGTHTASTAAGSAVANANLFGFANGTARGVATRARLAMYKACWGFYGCPVSDIVAAINAAVKDGVHILSLSLGGGPEEFYADAVAIAAFAAVRNGVFVAFSAGNSGPDEGYVVNIAPWITTVGAGSIDRKFPARVTLGNGEVYVGQSLYQQSPNFTGFAPLVYVPQCLMSDSEITQLVKEKILMCENAFVELGMKVAKARGVGLIGLNDNYSGEGVIVKAFTLPGLTLGYFEAQKLIKYINSTSNPRASLQFDYQTVIGESRAPTVAYFSARGPNIIQPEILKPDILAPGMNILASWPTETPLTGSLKDLRRAGFNIISGTSMSCPHIAGVAALLKAEHPNWSPAMIRSAMMTTAFPLDNSYRPIFLDESLKPANALAIGAGHVDPVRAKNPGLVYDLGVQDYINLLCTMNYTEAQIKRFMPEPSACSKFEGGVGDLNYPSFVAIFDAETKARTLTRTLTKVSELPETYEARVVNPRPDKVEVVVEPKTLEFGGQGENLSYKVRFVSKVDEISYTEVEREYGYIMWENTEHQVKSPVVFMWK
ncbi:subtilisin-like protease SBT1.8 [Asparagus officinalis]|uniref:subtilisin-like protease SBT1.8 n=1 Tax=Asparagus officinalis TaxID=4686 RepID=UPI00098E071A|nr:subtilisin-like protease SBT1.8 [Asparagus officinalis]